MRSNRGASQKRRGYLAELRVLKRLKRFGFVRVPLSGSAGGPWSSDLRRVKGEPKHLDLVEVKHRDELLKTLDNWLSHRPDVRGLVLERGARREPIFACYLRDLERVLEEAGYEVPADAAATSVSASRGAD